MLLVNIRLLLLLETREKCKVHVLDFIIILAIIPTLVGKFSLELIRLFKDLLLVPIVRKASFRNVFKTF